MSATIDERVVEMRFDNQHFEKNVSNTMSTLDKLKQSLNLTGATKGLENIDTATKKIDMSGLSNAVETVRAKFSALEVIGITALANITNSAINAGKKIVSALTIDPIKTGFAEYETQINAVQTILANTSSKGTTLDEVNAALDELNYYADKTIYNFTEMTRNIGTFTAAGVDLKTSVSAIQGIANLAAVSGSTSQQASTAMYQLSQALASGTVKLQDWNSVVNAGMGGEVFQNALKRTATVMGTNVDALIKKYGSFRESLTQGDWLTTDVLTETLYQFTMAAEEGTEQWEAYKKSLKEKGYTEEQAVEILKMANTATDAATKVKTFTQLWDTLKEAAQSGWTQTWEIIVGDFEEAKTLLTTISDVVSDFINESANARNTMLQGWKDMGGRTALIEGLTNIFKGLLSIIKPVSEAFKEVFPSITSEQLFNLTKGFKELTEKFKLSDSQAANLKNTFKALFSVVKLVADGILTLLGAVKPLAGFLFDILDGTLSLTGSFAGYVNGVKDSVKISDIFSKAIDGLCEVFKRLNERFKPLKAIGDFIKNTFTDIGKVIGRVTPSFAGLGTSIAKAFGTDGQTFNGNSLLDLFNSGVFAGILVAIKKLVDKFSEFEIFSGGFKDSIMEMLDGVKDSLSAYQTELKAGTLIKIASAIGILAVALVALALIDPTRLASALGGMTTMFIELFGAMAIFEKLAGGKSFKSISKLVTPMIGLSVAVLILSSAMTKLSKLDWNQLAKGLLGIAGATAILVVSASELSKNTGGIAKGALSLVIFATAINILAKAVEKLSGLGLNALIKGLGGVGVLLAELAIFMKVANFNSMGISSGTGILIMSSAIVVLAKAVEKFANIKASSLIKGLGAVAVVLAELAIFAKLTGNSSSIISTSVGLTILAGALNILALAVRMLGGLTWEELGKGLLGIAGALTIVAAAMYAMSGTIGGSAAMLVMATALAIFTPQLMLLSTLSLSEIGTGLLALAGAFTVIGVAGVLLTPLVPTLIGLAGAITLLGIGALAVGGGLLAFSAGLSALAVSGVAGAGALVTIVTTIIGLIPMLLIQLANGIVAFANVIAQGAPAIGAAITSVILSIIQTITMSIPSIVTSALELLTTLLTTLLNYIPTLMETGGKLIAAILQGIANNIGKIVVTAIDIVVQFINGVSSMIGKVVQAGVDLIISFINGLADSIRNSGPKLVDAVWNLFDALVDIAIDVLVSSIPNITNIGGKIISGLIKGFSSMVSGIGKAAKTVINTAIKTFKEHISNFKTIGSNIIQGVINGISGGVGKIATAAKNAAKTALNAAKNFLGIKSPSREFMTVGKYSDEGFAKGLERYAHLAGNAAKGVGNTALRTLKNSIGSMSFDSIEDQPAIRPILDLSDVQAGVNNLNGLFANNQAILLGANVDSSFLGRNANAIASMMANNQNGTNKDVVQAIKDLRTDVTDLYTAMSSMKVVMDSGALVGELINKIDNALGSIAEYKGRGN